MGKKYPNYLGNIMNSQRNTPKQDRLRIFHWNGNVVILTIFASLAAPECVKMTTACDENVVKITIFPFLCRSSEDIPCVYMYEWIAFLSEWKRHFRSFILVFVETPCECVCICAFVNKLLYWNTLCFTWYMLIYICAPSAILEDGQLNGPLTRYVRLWIVHAPEMPGTFSPPPTSKKTAS